MVSRCKMPCPVAHRCSHDLPLLGLRFSPQRSDQVAHVEEIARMLPIERRAEFPGIEVGEGHNRDPAKPNCASTAGDTARISDG